MRGVNDFSVPDGLRECLRSEPQLQIRRGGQDRASLYDVPTRILPAIPDSREHIGLKPKHGATLGWVYVEKGKTKYAKRYVPLTNRAKQILSAMDRKTAYVFEAESRERMNRSLPSAHFRGLRDAMKLPKDCVIHSCRHTYCTRLGEAGTDALVIQRLAGHSSILISQRYVHPTPERLEVAVANLTAYNEGMSKTNYGTKVQCTNQLQKAIL